MFSISISSDLYKLLTQICVISTLAFPIIFSSQKESMYKNSKLVFGIALSYFLYIIYYQIILYCYFILLKPRGTYNNKFWKFYIEFLWSGGIVAFSILSIILTIYQQNDHNGLGYIYC